MDRNHLAPQHTVPIESLMKRAMHATALPLCRPSHGAWVFEHVQVSQSLCVRGLCIVLCLGISHCAFHRHLPGTAWLGMAKATGSWFATCIASLGNSAAVYRASGYERAVLHWRFFNSFRTWFLIGFKKFDGEVVCVSTHKRLARRAHCSCALACNMLFRAGERWL